MTSKYTPSRKTVKTGFFEVCNMFLKEQNCYYKPFGAFDVGVMRGHANSIKCVHTTGISFSFWLETVVCSSSEVRLMIEFDPGDDDVLFARTYSFYKTKPSSSSTKYIFFDRTFY
jgi:hypothetical protein